MSEKDTGLDLLALDLGRQLRRAGWRCATAESCTGGWVAKVLTDVAGSSAWFERGYVSYSNAAKQDMLGVAPATLEAHGAVSEAVVREMARGAQTRAEVELSVAISGVAGPGGGCEDKPVGTVWFAWALADGDLWALRRQFSGDREAVRRKAVAEALKGLLEYARD
ncbi:nicotinamide-nucleotide amidase [Alkalilimnicola sp. S0819]|uniref:nicotinamide-nucleotide amidase n=1 Tax=Alkalilimnicola sp. S0819 TaxID=2613922 RepID=UPI001D017225|nr:nicotinamide-nucleotide amidase [Alkalilimnicola sp. S0819]